MNHSMTCESVLSQVDKCECELDFTLNEDISSPVFLYYSLKDFYQNHRRYVDSVDVDQLLGREVSTYDLESNCGPYSTVDGRQIAPCGAIANSMFNDTFLLVRIENDSKKEIQLNETEIVWPFERGQRFRNPPEETWPSYAKPINWNKSVFDLDKSHPENNGYLNGHLIVWMRPAAFPAFRKLWAKLELEDHGSKLAKGQYRIKIDYSKFWNLY